MILSQCILGLPTPQKMYAKTFVLWMSFDVNSTYFLLLWFVSEYLLLSKQGLLSVNVTFVLSLITKLSIFNKTSGL